MQETEIQVRSLGREDPLEEGMATHSSILAWRIPWTVEPGWLQSIGLQTVVHYWSDLAHNKYLLVIWMFSFVNSLLKCFAHFPNMLYFSYWYVRVLHTFWASHLLVIYLQMSSLYCVLPFLSVNGAFWWSEVLHFNVDSKLSVFSFLISSFCTCHKRCV